MNRLQFEYSPYLVSRASDPVDWLPWGAEALTRAQSEHKPLFIAIGTASRAQAIGSTAGRLVGRYYVPVQVDAREHPDVAAYYGQAARLLLGGMEKEVQVMAEPSGRPFFASRPMGGVELAAMLSTVALHWQSHPAGYERAAAVLDSKIAFPLGGRWHSEAVTDEGTAGAVPIPLISHSAANAALVTASPQGEAIFKVSTHFRLLQSHFDREFGGFGTGAKYLLLQELLFLLRYDTPEAMDMAVLTLNRMAQGAVRDHIGGGFFHGTADRAWQVPLPEKRLLDQAWMLECYVTAYGLTGAEHFAQAARDTADFVLRELRHEGGGFFTTQWAEDGFYEGTEACKAVRVGAVVPAARQESAGIMVGSMNTHTNSPDTELLSMHTARAAQSTAPTRTAEEDLRLALYRARLERGMPRREETVLVGHNGVMMAALCRAGQVLGVPRYMDAARQAEAFLRQRLVSAMDLRRYWAHGASVGDGALEDYAGYALGLLALYKTGFGRGYLYLASKVMARADALFSDRLGGGYFLTRPDGCLPVRPKQLWDESVPSAWSVAAEVLRRLGEETGHPGFQRRAREIGLQLDEYCGYGLSATM